MHFQLQLMFQERFCYYKSLYLLLKKNCLGNVTFLLKKTIYSLEVLWACLFLLTFSNKT